MTRPAKRGNLRLLHLGDSYTCSEGIPPEEGWPSLLAHMMESNGNKASHQQVLARTGWTSEELIEALDSQNPGLDWDLITLCIGVNNQYRQLTVHSFRSSLELLVSRIKALKPRSSRTIHILSIPDWGVSPFAASQNQDPKDISIAIDQFNLTCETIAHEHSLQYVEWTSLTRKFKDNPKAFAADNLHPSELQHRIWAEFLYQVVSKSI